MFYAAISWTPANNPDEIITREGKPVDVEFFHGSPAPWSFGQGETSDEAIEHATETVRLTAVEYDNRPVREGEW
jgi:hypothetical protein